MSDFEFLDDESESKYYFYEQVGMKAIKDGYTQNPAFAYQYIDIDKTDYCFSQKCFDNDDIVSYFKKLKEYSTKTVKELLETSHHKEHFHIIEPIPKRIKTMIETISGKTLKDENLPIIGQFGLYTNEKADKTTNIKSPRIFFFVGAYSIFHILFYDPFHEIFNSKK